MNARGVVGSLAGAAGAALAWGHFEAGWVRLRTLSVPVRGLPPELEGLRIAHLSDFHLGVPSRGARSVERAVDWVASRAPDLVCVSGDLLSRPRGERRLRELVARLPNCYAVLGNHDYGDSRDPFARKSPLGELEPAIELQQVRGDHRQPVERIRLRRWVAKLAGDLERCLMAPGRTAEIGPELQHALLVERLHLDHAIATPPRAVQRRREVGGCAAIVSGPIAHPPSLQQQTA